MSERPRPRSYIQVLADRRLTALLLGDLFSQTANGMLLVAMPLLALRIHGAVPVAFAVSLAATAPFVLATVVSLGLGLGRRQIPPRTLLLTDCVLRTVASGVTGVAAVAGELSLPTLILVLLLGSSFRLVGSSSRRLLATGMAGPEGRFAVNGLLGTVSSFAQYIVGPALGGLLTGLAEPGLVLLVDSAAALLLFATVRTVAPRRIRSRTVPDTDAPGADGKDGSGTGDNGTGDNDSGEEPAVPGWRVLRDSPQAARLFVVVFCFNFFYMPLEIALPLFVQGPLHAGGSSLGLLWGLFGIGALAGALGTGLLRRLPVQPTLVLAIALWALCPLGLAWAGSFWAAAVIFTAGGLVWAPFTPLVYTFLQSTLSETEQQPVVTLWGAGTAVAAPVGLALGGPLVHGIGVRPSLVVSGLLTVVLVPLAGWGLLRTRRTPHAP